MTKKCKRGAAYRRASDAANALSVSSNAQWSTTTGTRFGAPRTAFDKNSRAFEFREEEVSEAEDVSLLEAFEVRPDSVSSAQARAASRNGFARAGKVTRTSNRRAHASARGVSGASSSPSAEEDEAPTAPPNENADASLAAS